MAPLALTRPDDCHVHLRDGAALRTTVPHTARYFARAIVMPNLSPPVTTVAAALAYRARILDALPAGRRFTPLMTLYLTDHTAPDEIRRASATEGIAAVKLYPAGATTHSDAGVTRIEAVYPALEAMAEHGLPLLVHGEVTDPAVDIFDRERVFLERVLAPLVERFPGLRVVVEHITTREAVEFVSGARGGIAATITAHHLLLNRNALLAGGIRPHHYCLPVLKDEAHRRALLAAATGGNPRFFLGTDSAPHEVRSKENACGCAGIYSAHAALEFYAEAFHQAGALARLEAFAGVHGAAFYGWPRSTERLTLTEAPWEVPDSYPFGDGRLVALRAGQAVGWQVVGEADLGLRSDG